MELRVIRYFLAVAQMKNISRAAESLHLTQPTLSRQLSQLEKELGVSLFQRGAREITLTETGRLFLPRAEEILTAVERALAVLPSKDGASPLISIGMSEMLISEPLLKAIRRLKQGAAPARFHFIRSRAKSLLEKLDDGQLDFCLFPGYADDARYRSLILPQKNQWVVIMRADDPLAAMDAVSAADLRGQPLLLTKWAADHLLDAGFCADDAARLPVAATCDSSGDAAFLVRDGMGRAVTLAGTTSLYNPAEFAVRPLWSAAAGSASLLWQRHRPLAFAPQRFVSELEAQMKACAGE